MDSLHGLGLRQDQQVVIALLVMVMPDKTLAAKGGFIQFEILDFGSHGAIQHQNTVGGGLVQSLQRGNSVILAHDAVSTVGAGRSPIRWQIA